MRALPKMFAITFVAIVVTSNAWLCDDAFITMRTAEHFLRGDGLTWNPGERVQAYTHPLWLFGLAAARALIGDAYTAMLALSIATTIAAIWTLSRLGSHSRRALLIVLALGLSPSFVQYSTSGLENPATHLLLVIFGRLYFRGASLGTLAAISSLVALNRADAIVLVAPAMALETARSYRKHGTRDTLRALALACMPLVAWEIFSLVYYGSFVPNTAHAKLAHALPRSELARQGLAYLASFATFDPVGALVSAWGLSLGLVSIRIFPRRGAMALGGVAYIAYLVYIGGDFMAGRMLTPVIVLGAISLVTARVRAAPRIRHLAPIVLLLLAALPERHVLAVFSESWNVRISEGPMPLYSSHWVADEQRNYHESTGLLRVFDASTPPPWHGWYQAGLRFHAVGGVHEFRNIGFAGWAAADRAHIVDPYGLSEPLLARLPAFRNPDWHVGHYQRTVPPGYVRSIETGTCAMQTEELCALFRDLRLITRGPIFDVERARAMFRLAVYRPSPELTFEMRHPGLIEVDADESLSPVSFGDSGVRVRFPDTRSGGARAEVSACGEYELRFVRGGEVMYIERAPAVAANASCVLDAHWNEPYDMLWLLPQSRPGPYILRGVARIE